MENGQNPSVEEPSSPHPALRPRSIARAVWKQKVCILACWPLVAIFGIAIVRELPPVYLSEAVILVDSQKIPEKFVSATVAADLEDRIAAIRQQVLSRNELKKLIEEFGLYEKERKKHFEEEILEMMRADISITVEPIGVGKNDKRPGAFRVGYQGRNPALVAQVANRLTDLFVDQNLKTREGQAEGTSDFLEAQLREAKSGLDKLEAAVSAYKLKHNGELPEQERSLSGTLLRLQVELEANRDAINRAQQNKVTLSSNLSAMEANLAGQIGRAELGPGVVIQAGAPVRKRSEVLQEQLDLMRTKYSENYPDVIRMRGDVDKLKRAEAQEESAAPPASAGKNTPSDAPRVQRMTAADSAELTRTREQIATVRAQLTGIEKELENRAAEQQRILRDIATYQNRTERLPVREQELAQLTRDYEISKENYKSLLDKKMAAEMALDMERRQKSERFTVLDRAKVPEKPVKPNRPMLYAIASAASLALALITGFLRELRKNVFLGEWELPEDITILARLPYIEVSASSAVTLPEAARAARP